MLRGRSTAEALDRAEGRIAERHAGQLPAGSEVRWPPAEIRERWTEKEFTANVIDAAHYYGWRVAHFRTIETWTHGRRRWMTPVQGDGAGFPDLILARDGVVLAVELKVGKNKASLEQLAWLQVLRLPGGVWRPEDWNVILKALQEPELNR